MEFKRELKKLDACSDAIEWVGDMSMQEAWDRCERGDWMLWYLKKTNAVDLRTLTLIKVECAELVKHLMKDERSLKALKVAREFAEGNATREKLDAAAADAADAAVAAVAAADAADAADAAAAAAAYAADAAAYAADAAAYAADAAAAADDDDDAYARAGILKKAADICRKHGAKTVRVTKKM